MNIIVVGGKGFIGRTLVERLRQNHTVAVWDLPDVDIRRPDFFSGLLKKNRPDVIVNLAAVLGTMHSKNIWDIFETNVLGNINLAEYCAENGIQRYVFASSLTVHGENAPGDPRVLSSPFNPKHPYSASKASSEHFLAQYAKHRGMSVTVLRPTMVLGGGTHLAHAPIDFLRTVRSGKEIELYGSGEHEREWVWVDDVADGFCRAVDFCGRAAPGYYPFFLSGNRISMKALAEKCAAALGGTVRYVAGTAQAFTLTSDASESERVLGWKPSMDIDEMISQLITLQNRKEL